MPYLESALNKKIIISADNISSYENISLSKNNVINDIVFTNQSFLSPEYDSLNDPKKIASFSNIEQVTLNYAEQNIFNGSTNTFDLVADYSESGTETDERGTYKTIQNIATNTNPIKISGKLTVSNSQTTSGHTVNDSESYNFDIELQYERQYSKSLTVDFYGFWGLTTKTVTITLDYSERVLRFTFNFDSGGSGSMFRAKITAEVEINSIIQSVVVADDNTFLVDNNYLYAVREVSLILENNATIYEQTYTNANSPSSLSITLDVLRTTTDDDSSSNTSTMITPMSADGSLSGEITEFSSLQEFKTACNTFFNSYADNGFLGAFGIKPENVVKNSENTKIKHRFFSQFTIYLCWRVSSVSLATQYELQNGNLRYYYINPSLNAKQSFYINQEKKDEYTTTSIYQGFNTSFNIEANYLFQENTTINGIYAPSIIAENISEQYKNGRKVVSLTVFYGKYLDLDGNVVYNGTDGKYITVDDICVPYTIRNGVEVPLLTDKNGNAIEFRVTKSTLNYDGSATVSLTMLENT